jgi:hypothetical protein
VIDGTREQLLVGNTAEQDAPKPSVTMTVPVGIPTAGATGATVKATVTGCPAPDGAGESDVIVVVVLPRMVKFAAPALDR